MFSKFSKVQKNFIADLDELEHAKKKVVKMSNFWDDPPPPQLWIFTTFFFSNDNLPKNSIKVEKFWLLLSVINFHFNVRWKFAIILV